MIFIILSLQTGSDNGRMTGSRVSIIAYDKIRNIALTATGLIR